MSKFKQRDCVCDVFNIKLYLAWKFDITNNKAELLAICRTKELADGYARGYKSLTVRTWVDESISDHLLGSSMFGNKQ